MYLAVTSQICIPVTNATPFPTHHPTSSLVPTPPYSWSTSPPSIPTRIRPTMPVRISHTSHSPISRLMFFASTYQWLILPRRRLLHPRVNRSRSHLGSLEDKLQALLLAPLSALLLLLVVSSFYGVVISERFSGIRWLLWGWVIGVIMRRRRCQIRRLWLE